MKMHSMIPALFLLASATVCAESWTPREWPVLKHYDGDHLYRTALPLGGIGTGTVSLGGRGELRDWEIMNVPGKEFSTVTTGNNSPFFAVYVREEGKSPVSSLLEGPLYPEEYSHKEGRPVNHYGFPRFSEATFDAAYPFGQVNLSDEDITVTVRVKGFNPLVPGDEDASGLPVAVLVYQVTNTGDAPADVSVCGSLRNFIGCDGSRQGKDWKGDEIPQGAKDNKNEFREGHHCKGIYFRSEGVDSLDQAWGTIALTTSSDGLVSYRTASRQDYWNNAILSFWDDFSEDGVMTEKYDQTEADPMASLCVKKTLSPGATEDFIFYLTWNFPNRKAWSRTIVGNYYSGRYPDAWETAEEVIPRMPSLEALTLQFVNAFLDSDYPEAVKESALFNLSVLRSQTVFRLPDGHLMGWEGVMDRSGSCAGSCTHVWNYEVATPFLFGDLSRTMRDVEFNYATKDNGLMNFRAALPLSEASSGNSAAADGQMGCIMKMYRDWQLSGDDEFLSSNWGQVKKALSFAWIDGGWDGNQDGVMEGSQHNTMDVNYFGPNPQMGFWYMGALRAGEEMAKAMKDKDFAKKCRTLFEQGSRWMDENLFNGEYYEQKITDPQTFEFLNMSDPNVRVPDYQLYKGCLVDQLAGQYMAHICGLGYLGDKAHIRKTMESVMKYNFLQDFSRHFNNMRSYVMGREAGLLMAAWPKGRLDVPFPYFSEAMTGFEYCAAVGMMYEGMEEEGLICVKSIRDRFDGAKRNPFDEPECGHNYARSMASWASVLALSGFHYSGIDRTINFTSRPGKYFWANGESWGLCTVEPSKVTLKVISGSLDIDRFTLTGLEKPVGKMFSLDAGEKAEFLFGK